ncbi:MFS transporter [Georgenia halophila]|uniref:MFS transporter n=1 Tax=Georgenia halophila TaxID=620889 RepID=A0ABP8LMQ5_9MICO
MNLAAPFRRLMHGRTALPRSVFVLASISFTVAVGFGVMLPVLPVFAKSFGVGTFAASAVVSAFAFARLVAAPGVGPLLSRTGEKPILVAGILIVAVSTAASALAASYVQFLIFRGVGGIGSAMFSVSGMTLLLNTVAPDLRGRASSFYMGGFLLGGMAGPAIGGLLAAISLRAPFFFYAGALVVAGAIGIVVLRSSDRHRSPDAAEVRPLRAVLRDPRFQAAAVAGLGQGWTSFGVRSALVPIMVVEVLHREPSWTAVAFTVSSVVQALLLGPAGRFVDVVGRRPAMIAAGLVGAGAIVGASFATNIWVLTIALSVYGAGAAFLSTAPPAAVGDAAGARSGTPVALFSMITDLGAIIGPLAAGWIAGHGSYPLAFGVGAVIMVGGSLLAVRMPGGPPGRLDTADDTDPARSGPPNTGEGRTGPGRRS